MSENNPLSLDELHAVPFGELIASVGRGVADAQRALDEATLATWQRLLSADDPTAQLLRSIGYQPTWYTLPETKGSIKLAFTMRADASGQLQLQASTMNATYTNHYDYALELASNVEFKIVPVPAPVRAEGLVLVPDTVGADWPDALATLLAAGLEPAPFDQAGAVATPLAGWKVLSQRPAANALAPSCGRVVVVVAPPTRGVSGLSLSATRG